MTNALLDVQWDEELASNAPLNSEPSATHEADEDTIQQDSST